MWTVLNETNSSLAMSLSESGPRRMGQLERGQTVAHHSRVRARGECRSGLRERGGHPCGVTGGSEHPGQAQQRVGQLRWLTPGCHRGGSLLEWGQCLVEPAGGGQRESQRDAGDADHAVDPPLVGHVHRSNLGGVLTGGSSGLAHALAPWTGFGVLCGYAAVLIGIAAWRLRRVDA